MSLSSYFQGPKYAEAGRPQSAKVLRQPVNLKPDGSSQSFIPQSSVRQGSNIVLHYLKDRINIPKVNCP